MRRLLLALCLAVSAGVSLTSVPAAAAASESSTQQEYVAFFTFPGHPEEYYRVRLTDPADIQTAQWMLKTGTRLVPVGLVVYGSPDVNIPWSWHIDPANFQFSQGSIEVCDGFPSEVEKHLITSDYFCPWSAVLTSLTPI
jgi:hypothetical protein